MSLKSTIAVRAWAEGRIIWIELQDGRKVSFPAENYRLLKNAKDQDLAKVRIEARGRALR